MSDIGKTLGAVGKQIDQMVADHEKERLRLSGLLAQEKKEATALHSLLDDARKTIVTERALRRSAERNAMKFAEDLNAEMRRSDGLSEELMRAHARLNARIDALDPENDNTSTEAAE